MFLQVAKLYIQAKTQDGSTQPQAASNNESNYYTAPDGNQFDLNTMSSFDPYLSALGLMPNPQWPEVGYNNVPASTGMEDFSQIPGMGLPSGPGAMEVGMGFGPPGGNQNSLQDWFSGSRYLMNLMEAGDDMQMPDLDL